VRLLGEGTFGKVWLYAQHESDKPVAVKFFTRGTSRQFRGLLAEVKKLALLDGDPGIVQVYDVEADAVPPYFVMTYAPGGSLAQLLAARGKLPVPEALALFRRVTEALAYVHAKGIRHCDLKPGNVLLDAVGRPLVADFGQAHLHGEVTPALGTFFYMGPDQAEVGKSIPDTRWDVYGLGALFYAMLTGRPPRESAALRDELARTGDLAHRLTRYREWLHQAPHPDAHRRLPGMDRRLAALIDRCLELDPGKRLRDAGAVLAALDRRDRHRRRRPLLLFGLVAPVALLLAMLFAGILFGRQTVHDSEGALTRQLLNNDLVAAHLIANVVQEKLDDRARVLDRRARAPALARAVKQKETREQLRARLQRYKEADQENFFFKWSLIDARGFLLADVIPEDELYGRCWAWRDWFNGTGNKLGREEEFFDPVRSLHVSQPYVSQGVDEQGRPRPLCLSISCPVFDPDDPRAVAAVLVGTMHVHGLHDWLEGSGFDDTHAFPVLLNERRHCLLHPREESWKPRRGANPEAFDCPVFREVIDERRADTTDDHHDPLDGQTYLAAYVPVPKYGWGVVVQHDREAALQPVHDLRVRVRRFGLFAAAAMGALTSGLWVWLIASLRREERVTHG
jgi:predicted Ser/Thr protein kinase